MKKSIVLITLGVLIVVALLVVSTTPEQPVQTHEQKRLKVSVSTYALYEAARQVGGEMIDVNMIVPFGTDLHSFEPTPKDMAELENSALIFFSGAGLEPWMHAYENRPQVIDISQVVGLRHLEEKDEHEAHGEADEHHHDDACSDDDVDPHYWLSPDNMVAATRFIAEKLGTTLPEMKPMFEKNAEVFVTQLHMLDNRYRSELASCKKQFIVVNHNAVGYIADRYGFDVHPLSGLSPEAMPSAKRMAELSDFIQSYEVKTIFFESFVSDRLMNEIAHETGAMVDTLQPLGNITADEAAQGLGYIQLMERNLAKLRTAMECE